MPSHIKICRKHNRDYRKFPMRLVLPDASKISKKRTLAFIIQKTGAFSLNF